MHQRTITCSCLTDAYPLSQDPSAAEADVKDFLAQHAHPGVRPWPQPRRPDSALPAGYLAVFIDGPNDGEVHVLPEYVAEIPDERPATPGVYRPEEAQVGVSRILHYQWYVSSPSVLLQTSS